MHIPKLSGENANDGDARVPRDRVTSRAGKMPGLGKGDSGPDALGPSSHWQAHEKKELPDYASATSTLHNNPYISIDMTSDTSCGEQFYSIEKSEHIERQDGGQGPF